jgi:hypothetical protein
MSNDFWLFARNALKIEGKEPGSVYDFDFNDAQKILHAAIVLMMAEIGFVRIIIVKGRQQGISTYLQLRLFWIAYFRGNVKVSTITHEDKATAALFGKVKFAFDNLPPRLQVKADTNNTEVLKLPNGSQFTGLTAGSKESGRSQTAHFQHQSERAFFENPIEIDAGAGQIVGMVPGTEVYKESTANGWNHFRLEVLNALKGEGLFRVVFIPWYIQKEYRVRVPANFTLTDEEVRLKRIFRIDDEQIMFRRAKIFEFIAIGQAGAERKFKQEYPFTLMEAFQSAKGSFYDSTLIEEAIRSTVKGIGPRILGVDPGREGDRTIITLRQGRQVIKFWKYDAMNSDRLANIVADIIRKESIDKVFIDWAEGSGTIDQLRKLKFGDLVEGIRFGEGADNEIYLNKRAEMACKFDEWLRDGECNLPNDDDMVADIGSMPQWEPSAHSKIKFPDKKEIKKDYGRSPDILDSIMLTFARPVRELKPYDDRAKSSKVKNSKKKSALEAMN